MKRYLEAQQARADAAKGFTDLKSKISKGKGYKYNYALLKLSDMGNTFNLV